MKKIMKRLLIVVIIIATCCATLFGCSSSAPETYGEPQGYYLYMGFNKCLEDGSDKQTLVEEVTDGENSYEILQHIDYIYVDDVAYFIVQDEREYYNIVKYDLINQAQEVIYSCDEYISIIFSTAEYLYLSFYDSYYRVYFCNKIDSSGNTLLENVDYIIGGQKCGDSIFYLDSGILTSTIYITNIKTDEMAQIELDGKYNASEIINERFYAYKYEIVTMSVKSYSRTSCYIYEEATQKSLSIDEQYDGKQINFDEEYFMASTAVEKESSSFEITFGNCVLYKVNEEMQIEQIIALQGDIDFTNFTAIEDDLVSLRGEKLCTKLISGDSITRIFDNIYVDASSKCYVLKEDYYENAGEKAVDGVAIDNYIFYVEFSSNGMWSGSSAMYVMRYNTITKLHECVWYKPTVYDGESYILCNVANK